MAKQIMVLKVRMRCEKCKTKAFKIVAGTHGVTALRLEGEDQEKLVVEGRGVNVAGLVQTLTRKVGFTEILHLSELTTI